MKVLENKNYIEVECQHCHSKLGVHMDDIHYNDVPHRSPMFSAACGACGDLTEVKSAQIPAAWMRSIVGDDIGH